MTVTVASSVCRAFSALVFITSSQLLLLTMTMIVMTMMG